MDESVGLNALRVDLGDWVDRVHYTGEAVIITKKGKPWARICPLLPEPQPFAKGGMIGPSDPNLIITNDCHSGLGWTK